MQQRQGKVKGGQEEGQVVGGSTRAPDARPGLMRAGRTSRRPHDELVLTAASGRVDP